MRRPWPQNLPRRRGDPRSGPHGCQIWPFSGAWPPTTTAATPYGRHRNALLLRTRRPVPRVIVPVGAPVCPGAVRAECCRTPPARTGGGAPCLPQSSCAPGAAETLARLRREGGVCRFVCFSDQPRDRGADRSRPDPHRLHQGARGRGDSGWHARASAGECEPWDRDVPMRFGPGVGKASAGISTAHSDNSTVRLRPLGHRRGKQGVRGYFDPTFSLPGVVRSYEALTPTARVLAGRVRGQARQQRPPISQYREMSGCMRASPPRGAGVTHDAGSPQAQLAPFCAAVPESQIPWGRSHTLGADFGPIREGADSPGRRRFASTSWAPGPSAYSDWTSTAAPGWRRHLGAHPAAIEQPAEFGPAFSRARDITDMPVGPVLLRFIVAFETAVSSRGAFGMMQRRVPRPRPAGARGRASRQAPAGRLRADSARARPGR